YSPPASFDVPLRLGEPEGFAAELFPNPVNDVYNVRVTTDQATDATFTVTGRDGKILSTTTQRVIPGNGSIAFGAEWLPSGMYLLHVTNGEQTRVLRFAVMR
ncbi:MAG TPA: T9SS type A sorting domain-containing protein, partial [Chitinophagales bacterium]|nr:T9SS type A sorting domain-containing protein [Chitinophagales bacterium]